MDFKGKYSNLAENDIKKVVISNESFAIGELLDKILKELGRMK